MRILIHMIAMILAVRKSNEVLQDNANLILQALRFSFDIRLRCLEVEIGPCLAPAGVLVYDIFHWKSAFQFLQFSFTKSVYDKALLKVWLQRSVQVWLQDHPICINRFVLFDSIQ